MTAFDYSNDMMSFKTTYNYFIQVTIRMSSNVEEVLRKYQKIQTILSYIGGFNFDETSQADVWFVRYSFLWGLFLLFEACA